MTRSFPRILIFACVLALVAIGLMVWSILVPTPLPVMVAMSVAQGIGTLSLLLYGVAIVRELRANVRDSLRPDRPSKGEPSPPS